MRAIVISAVVVLFLKESLSPHHDTRERSLLVSPAAVLFLHEFLLSSNFLRLLRMCFTNYSSIKKIKKIKIRGSCFPISISDRGRYFTHCRVISSEIAVSVSAPLRVVVTSPTLVLFFQRWLLIFLLSASQRVVVTSPTVVLFLQRSLFPYQHLRGWSLLHPLLCYFFRGGCFHISISESGRCFTHCRLVSSGDLFPGRHLTLWPIRHQYIHQM